MVFRDDDCLISRYQANEKCILRECEMSYWWGKMKNTDIMKSTTEYIIQSSSNNIAILRHGQSRERLTSEYSSKQRNISID